MTIPFPFEAMLVFAYLGVMLLVGVVLRAKIRLLQTFLFPSCLIGGVFGLMLPSISQPVMWMLRTLPALDTIPPPSL